VSHFRQATLLAALLALACGAGCARKAQQGQFKMPPMPVETATVTRETVADRFVTVGTLEAVDQIVVVTEIDAQVIALPFREGGEIRRGGLIAQLDDVQLRAESARAEALRDQRRAALQRVQLVVEQGAGSPQDLDDAQAALKVAEADLTLARARLGKTRVTAPFDGTLGARRVSVGHYLRAGDAITELAGLTELRVRFTAPELYLAKLRQGAPVAVSTPAFPDAMLQGEIEVVEPVVDAGTRSVRIVARLANPGSLLRPGMSADVTVVLSERLDALVVPSEAIFAQGEQQLVYVIKADSTVAPAPLTLGLRQAASVEVLGGLAAGDLVVRTGHQKLFPGAKVLPLPAGGAPAPAGGETR
jgi:membrane fusion protein (multidrug efflux system)